MSAANSLPSVIVKSILQHLSSSFYKTSEFKRKLELLAVCKIWREYALPLVFKKLYFYSPSPLFKSFNCGKNAEYNRATSGQTNIDLIKDLNVSHMVKHLELNIYKASGFIDSFIDEADSIFEFDQHNWSKVCLITLNIPQSYYDSNDQGKYFCNDSQQQIIQFVKKLYIAMPNVVEMDVRVGINSKHRLFAKELVKMYADQLQVIETCSFNNAFQYCKNTKKLRKLLVLLDSTFNWQRNNICLESITSLQITDIKSFKDMFSYLLAPFSDNASLAFPNLKTLDIQFRGTNPAAINHYGYPEFENSLYQFPSIKKLIIQSPFVIDFMNFLKFQNVCFPNLKKLYLQFGFIRNFNNNNITPVDISVSGLTNVINELDKTMPKLSIVQITNSREKFLEKSLLNCFANGFNSKLISMPTIKSINLDNVYFSKNLASLDITVDNINTFWLIDFNKNTLKFLSLLKINGTFKWSCLNPNSCGNMQFKQLNDLKLQFASDDNDDEIITNNNIPNSHSQQCVIDFPKLKKLKIDEVECNCLVKLLTDNKADISGVSSLSIKLGKYQDSDWSNSLNMSLDKVGYLIKQSIPNVTDMQITDPSRICLPLTDAINQLYSSQVYQMNLYTECLEHYGFSPSNKFLTISGTISNLDDARMPQINTSNLESLVMKMNLDRFSWSWFTNQSCVDGLEFSKMKRLYINFKPNTKCQQESHDNAIQPCHIDNCGIDLGRQLVSIRLPHIQFFELNFHDSLQSPLPCSFDFSFIDKVSLSGPVGTLPICGNKNPIVHEEMEVKITSVSKADEDYFYQFTNSWYGATQPICKCSLSITNLQIGLDLQKINWTYVDNLELCFELNALELFGLLPLLPNAQSVAIDCLTAADNIKDQVYIGQPTTIKPLSTMLDTITLGFSDTVVDDSIKDGIISYILVALPSLENVEINGYKFDFTLFVETYGQQYPHLYSINVDSEQEESEEEDTE